MWRANLQLLIWKVILLIDAFYIGMLTVSLKVDIRKKGFLVISEIFFFLSCIWLSLSYFISMSTLYTLLPLFITVFLSSYFALIKISLLSLFLYLSLYFLIFTFFFYISNVYYNLPLFELYWTGNCVSRLLASKLVR